MKCEPERGVLSLLISFVPEQQFSEAVKTRGDGDTEWGLPHFVALCRKQ